MNNLILGTGLWKTYDLGKGVSVNALRGLDICVDDNEFIAIVGPSGSGKSTLLNLLGCLDTPTKGELRFDGESVSGMKETKLTETRSEKIGFIFQTFNLLPALTALENVEFATRNVRRDKRMSKASRVKRAEECLMSMGLENRIRHRPSELSGGERQRVAIARAFANDPKLILADEPTGNLDSVATANVIELLHQLHANGKTVVMVTHDMEIIKGTRILRMRDGIIES